MNPERIHLIDPTVDCVVKRLLGSEQHKDLTLSFHTLKELSDTKARLSDNEAKLSTTEAELSDTKAMLQELAKRMSALEQSQGGSTHA